ncbi:hypothetical protein TW80_12045 [Loktanella sp. S4079]|nr:hypothetical protein TW80_12045 [Loktanella sp. S4079]
MRYCARKADCGACALTVCDADSSIQTAVVHKLNDTASFQDRTIRAQLGLAGNPKDLPLFQMAIDPPDQIYTYE